MYLYQHNFWQGFLEETDSLKLSFFLALFSRVFDQEVKHTTNLEQADILLESLGTISMIDRKPWKYSVLFSGESRLCPYSHKFKCILWGRRDQGNIVSLPLFIPYMISSGAREQIAYMDRYREECRDRPLPYKKSILAVISNGNSRPRSAILDILSAYFPIEYAGRYRTNRPVIEAPYFSEEFWKEASQYRCILCLENSRDDGYVTEKITHGMAAGTVSIYWGAPNVEDYFNPARFIHIKDYEGPSMVEAIQKIARCMNDDAFYESMLLESVFKGEQDVDSVLENHITSVVEKVRKILGVQ
jgi:Glycosyltransferase family 10 (fucosyltransferase) C-term